MPGIVSRCDLQILEEKTCAKNASGRRKTEIGIVRKRERKDFGHPFFLANTDFQWVCVCVCSLYCIPLANCPCTWCNSVAHLQLRIFPQPQTRSPSLSHTISPLFRPVCNLIWNFCTIQQNWAQKYDPTQYEKRLRRKT